jgi:predicted ATP-grasp superfamily ATP-dependent carboligase
MLFRETVLFTKVVFLKALKFTFPDRFFVKGKYYQPTSAVEVDHRQFKDIFEDVLVKIGYQGICCFNYKLVANDMKIFEVNPRYGGSMTRFLNGALVSYRSMLSGI